MRQQKHFSRRAPIVIKVSAMLFCGSLVIFLLAACASNGSVSSSSEGMSVNEPSETELFEGKVQSKLKQMTLEEKISQMFIISPESLTGVDTVIQAGDTSKNAISNYPVGGLLFRTPNLQNPSQTKEMLFNFQKFSDNRVGLSLFLCVDEEGGTVTRVGGNEGFSYKNVGDMADIGATGDPSKAGRAASYIADYLKELGFNVDFAPVADIADTSDSYMSKRSFSSEADVVSKMVDAQIKAFLSGGILCCAKHFPGIGSASADSHETNIYSNKTINEMKSDELKPFQTAIEDKVPFMMVGHLSTPNVTAGGGNVPASLNKVFVTDLLRNEMKYEGVILTDSLGMGAVTGLFNSKEVGVAAIEAGNDIILTPENFKDAYSGILEAVKSGKISESRIDESVTRILRLKMQNAK